MTNERSYIWYVYTLGVYTAAEGITSCKIQLLPYGAEEKTAEQSFSSTESLLQLPRRFLGMSYCTEMTLWKQIQLTSTNGHVSELRILFLMAIFS